MPTPKSPERLTFFTDAVVAIAMTLLVLPLTERVPELVSEHKNSIEAITGNQWQFYSFLLSFVVIGGQWINHHRLFQEVKAYSGALLRLNFLWLLTVVVLPFPTEMVAGFDRDRFTMAFYIGTILLNSLSLTTMVVLVRKNHEIQRSPGGISTHWMANSIASTVALAFSLLLAVLVPSIGYFSLLLLLLPPLVSRLIRFRETSASEA